jgi:predicted transcriptional regulator
MAKISIILPDEDKNLIEKIAKSQERNLSWVVRKAIQDYIKKNSEEEKE